MRMVFEGWEDGELNAEGGGGGGGRWIKTDRRGEGPRLFHIHKLARKSL